jgi:hypothetical protein
MPGYALVSIGEGAFDFCTSLVSVTIPASVTSIGDGAFELCTSLVSVTIPGSVTSIGDFAFEVCTSLVSVTIPASVTNIGDFAFCNCYSLTSVTIPASVTYIGQGAFQSCHSLTSVTIPASVTYIGSLVFYNCTALTSIIVHPDNPNYASVEGVLFDKDLTFLMQCPGGFPGAYIIPDSVTYIGYGAFYNCTSLTSIIVHPDNPNYASVEGVLFDKDLTFLMQCPGGFSGAYIIPDSVTSIGDWAFEGCSSLTSVTIPASVTYIDLLAFYNCTALTSIIVHPDNPNYASVEGVLFDKDISFLIECPVGFSGVYSIPDSVTDIGDCAFSGCTGLTGVEIGSGVTSIGEWAFFGCTGIRDVTLNANLSSFRASSVFSDSGQSWTNLVIGSNVTNIGDSAFSGCTGLTSVTITDSVASIGDWAFMYCESLTSVTITDSVASIGDWAFAYCESLTSVTIPDSVASIGEAPFTACSSLTNISVAADNPVCRDIGGVLYSKDASTLITFPAGRGGEYAVHDGTACIGRYAFDGCDGLTGLWLPASVTNVGGVTVRGDWILYGKQFPINNSSALGVGVSLTNISVAAENPVYRDIGGVLYSKDGATLLTFPAGRAGGYAVPPGVLRISAGAFADRSALTNVTIPGSVIGIESCAFFNCGGLTNIVFGSGVVDIGTLAFARCTGLTSVVIGDAVTNIGDGAFFECYGLTDVVIPDSVVSIGYGAFGDNAKLTGVTLPGGVTRVGDYAFAGCYPGGGLTNAVMSNVRVMGPNTFAYRPELAEVVFTASEPPRIVGEFWTQTNGVYSNWVGEAGADWEFPTWQNDGDFTVLVPAAYLNNWVSDVAHPVWRGRPVRTLESAWGISGTFDFAVDDRRGLEWTTAGWFAQSAVRYSGSMALQSGDIGNEQTSSAQTTVKNDGTVTFRYRVSSEEGYDFLNVYLDGALVLQDSGERAEWREARIVVRGTGKHKIRWDYVKDDSYSDGADCAWVDAVVWEPGTASTEVPVPHAWLDRFGLAVGVGYEIAAVTDTDGDGYPAWEEYVAGTDPTDEASVLTALIAVRDGVPSVTWEPDMGSARVYTIEGKASLTGDWQSPANATHRFFRVKVSMGIP